MKKNGLENTTLVMPSPLIYYSNIKNKSLNASKFQFYLILFF